jgi:citronellol/citronellal dehydrogenase
MVARHGPIHGLVNNAGGQFPAPLHGHQQEGLRRRGGQQPDGGFLMMREVFLQSMQAHGGAIVNMTADFRNGMPGMGHSGAARAGMSNLTMTPPSSGPAAACA